jgi:hypothetical protein
LFQAKPAAIVRDVRQQLLLNRWETGRGERSLPRLIDLEASDLSDLWDDLVLFEVQRGPPDKRYRARLHGRISWTGFGGPVSGKAFAERYLEDTLPPPLQVTIRAAYDAVVVNRRPVYTVRHAVDQTRQPVAFERLLLPASEVSENVDVIIVHLALHSATFHPDRQSLLRHGADHTDYNLKAIIAEQPSRENHEA